MIKIIETYSHKLISNVKMSSIYWHEIIDPNGVCVSTYSAETLPDFNIFCNKYKSENAAKLLILKAKVNAIESDKNGILLVVKTEDTASCAILFKELSGKDAQVFSLYLNGIPFYKYTNKLTVNPTILHKLYNVYDSIKKIDIEKKSLEITIFSIVESYKNTGIISQDDLIWMNKIYNKIKIGRLI